MNRDVSLKRGLLYLAVVSILLAALLGIVLILRNTWDWFEVRVILTTVTVGVASLCGLACDVSRTPRGRNLLPAAGFVLTAGAAGMILVGMWAELDSEPFWKVATSTCVLSVAATHVSLLSIARLASRFRWVFAIACQIVFGLALLIIAIIVWEINVEQVFRLVAALAILDAAITLAIPILHRISKTDADSRTVMSIVEQNNLTAIDDEISRLRQRIAELEGVRSELARQQAGSQQAPSTPPTTGDRAGRFPTF
jgi:hypothetical protein